MRFEWDPQKERSNRSKHRITFLEAESVFLDPLAITIPDEAHSTKSEPREWTIGYSFKLRLLVVVHTILDRDVIRIISARKATKQETQDHEEEVEERLREDGERRRVADDQS